RPRGNCPSGGSRLEPSPRPQASPGHSGLFSVLSRTESTQVLIINRVMFLDVLRLAEGLHNPGYTWTEAEDHAIRTLPAPEAARQLGRPLWVVYNRRQDLGVPDGRRLRPILPKGE